MNPHSLPVVEPLEARIAPAAVFSYRDADGDLVKLTTSKGTNAQLAAVVTFALLDITHIEVRKIDFSKDPGTFGGTSLTMSVTPNPLGGDGRANIGAIIATGMDLGDIKILGDLGQIDAGNPMLATPAIKSLTVGSLGAEGLATQGGTGDNTSTLTGFAPKVTVRGDLVGGIETKGSGAGFGSIKIGGSIREGGIGTTGNVGSLMVGGDVRGLYSASTGGLSAVGIGSVVIKGSLIGGDQASTGNIIATGDIGSVSIGGSLIGGDAANSGLVSAGGKIGNIRIGRDIIGGSSGVFGQASGTISAGGDIPKVTVGGSIISKLNAGAFHTTGIRSGGQLGSVTVGGSLVGATASNPVTISGSGDSTPTPGSNIAIGSVKIGGSAIHAFIVGGIDRGENPNFITGNNADAQIGSVTIAGDLYGTSIMTGVKSMDLFVGDADDTLIATGNTAGTVASIAKIVIGGAVHQTSQPGVIECGIVAEHIGSLKLGAATVKLNPLGGAKDRLELGTLNRGVPLWEV